MSFSFKLISHPVASDGSYPEKLLKDHLSTVGRTAEDVIRNLSIDPLRVGDEEITKEDLVKMAYVIGISHDFGKSTTYFQRHVIGDDRGNVTERSFHSQISSLFGYWLCSRILDGESPKYELLRSVAYLTIYYHHGDLKDPPENFEDLRGKKGVVMEQVEDIRSHSLPEIEAVYDALLNERRVRVSDFLHENVITSIYDNLKHAYACLDTHPSDDNYFLVVLLYSALLYADKLDASGIDYGRIRDGRKDWLELPHSIIDEYKAVLSSKDAGSSGINPEITRLRDESYREAVDSLSRIDLAENRLLSLELPTGLGKTLTSFGIAFRMRETIQKRFNFTPRIIYSLPFLSIIDQNFNTLNKVLLKHFKEPPPTSLLLKHHHLSDIYFTFGGHGDSDTESDAVQDVGKRRLLMEGWNSEIVVTSFEQLFHTLITNRNAAAMKFHNIANSIIILDEVQSIPYKYLKLVSKVLEYIAYHFNTWVILMTATMPIMFEPGATKPLISNSDRYFSAMDRIRYRRIPGEMKLVDLAADVLSERNRGKDILVVVNTVDASKRLYSMIKEKMSSGGKPPDVSKGYAVFDDTFLINLSTYVAPVQRKERIGLIEERKTEGKRVIVVSTQLIEAGVDIDLDVVYRDMAPVDSFVQAGGRANRNGRKDCGEVILVVLVCDNGRIEDNGRKYSDIYDSTLLDVTQAVMQRIFGNDGVERRITEPDMHKSVQEYYKEEVGVKSDSDSTRYIKGLRLLKFSTEIKGFSLINDKRPKADVFVPLDGEAEVVWKEYQKIKNLQDPIERWKGLLGIRNRFYNYVVAVDKRIVCNSDEPVTRLELDSYDRETGVKRERNRECDKSYLFA